MKKAAVITFGRAGSPVTQTDKVAHLAKKHNVRELYVIDPPEQPGGPGWHQVATSYDGPVIQADGGCVTQSGQSLLIHSRDCHIVVIENLQNGYVGVAHAGSESLINRNSHCCVQYGVIENLIPALRIGDGSQARAYVTAGIGARQFVHDDWKFVKPFVKEYGPKVVIDHQRCALDVLAVIQEKLRRYGITAVEHDGLCTFETSWLGSKRGGKRGANWVFVKKK